MIFIGKEKNNFLWGNGKAGVLNYMNIPKDTWKHEHVAIVNDCHFRFSHRWHFLVHFSR